MNARDPRAWLRFGACLFAMSFFISISAAESALAVLGAALLALAYRGQESVRPGPSGLESSWAAYICVVLAASVFGVDPARSFKYLGKDLEKALAFFVLLAAFRLEPTPRAMRWLLAGALTAALMGIYQAVSYRFWPSLLGWSYPAWYSPSYRAHAWTHPVTYGEQMTFALCVSGALWLRPDARAGVSRRLVGAAFAACLAALLLSQTRGAWLGLTAAALVAAACTPWRRLLPLAAGGALLAALAFAPIHPLASALRDRITQSGHAADSNSTRRALWRTALEISADRPVLGVGLNNFRTVFRAYHPGLLEDRPDWGSAHNLYLHQLAERGLLGLGALLAMLFSFAWVALREERRRRDAWSLAALSATAALCVMNLTQTAFQEAMVGIPFLFLWTWSLRVGKAEAPS